MIDSTDAGRNRALVWRSPPWTVDSVPWREIDQVLAADHLARRIRAFVLGLDLDPLRQSYLGVGKQPLPPELMLMVVLYEIHRGQLHPCHWAEDCQFSDPVKWLALGLQPSASSFYAFRLRLGPYVKFWNQQLIQQAMAEGSTAGTEAAIDGTFVAALGSRHRLLQAKTLEQRVQVLQQALAEDRRAARTGVATSAGTNPATGPAATPPPDGVPAAARATAARHVSAAGSPYWMATTPRGRGRQLYRYRQAQRRLDALLANHAQRENRKAKRKRRSREQVRICPREPEAALGRDKLKTFRPLYNVQLTSDLQTPLILDYGVHASNTDAGLFIPTVQTLTQTLGQAPATVLVDGIYATAANLAYSAAHDLTLYAPVDEAPRPTPKGAATTPAKQLGKEHFRWDAAAKTYDCPEGHRLIQIGCTAEKREQDQEVLVYQYRCPPQHCRVCPRAAQCTKAPDKGRTIKRSEHEEKVEALRQRMHTPEGQALYKKRKQSVEPRIGDLKAHRGLRCFAAFGMALAMVQVGLLVLVHNALCLPTRSTQPCVSARDSSLEAPQLPCADNLADHQAEVPGLQRPLPQAPT